MVVLNQMVIGVARERQWIEPERVDRRLRKLHQPGTKRRQMRQVMAQNIVTDQMPRIPQHRLQLIKCRRDTGALAANNISLSAMNRSQIEHARSFWVNLKVNRHTGFQEWIAWFDNLRQDDTGDVIQIIGLSDASKHQWSSVQEFYADWEIIE